MNGQKRILVADDEPDLCEVLQFNREAAGYEAVTALSAEEALKHLEQRRFHLLLLDVMMPGMSGFHLASLLRRREPTARLPIIFLTARDSEEDTLRGFDAGADDYIPKPFSVREVLARVRAVLTRADTGEEEMAHEGLRMCWDEKRVEVDGHPVPVTRTEFDLLWLLLSHRGTVFTRQQVLERVWPREVIVTERTVDVNMARLRKKLGRYAACIVSRAGFGYCFDTHEKTL